MSWWGDTLDEEIEKQQKQKSRKKTAPDDEDAEIDLRVEREERIPINRVKSVFDTSGGRNTPGINTAPSAFERSAVFKKI